MDQITVWFQHDSFGFVSSLAGAGNVPCSFTMIGDSVWMCSDWKVRRERGKRFASASSGSSAF